MTKLFLLTLVLFCVGCEKKENNNKCDKKCEIHYLTDEYKCEKIFTTDFGIEATNCVDPEGSKVAFIMNPTTIRKVCE